MGTPAGRHVRGDRRAAPALARAVNTYPHLLDGGATSRSAARRASRSAFVCLVGRSCRSMSTPCTARRTRVTSRRNLLGCSSSSVGSPATTTPGCSSRSTNCTTSHYRHWRPSSWVSTGRRSCACLADCPKAITLDDLVRSIRSRRPSSTTAITCAHAGRADKEGTLLLAAIRRDRLHRPVVRRLHDPLALRSHRVGVKPSHV